MSKPINETADIARFIIAALDTYDDVMKDKKVGIADVPALLRLMKPAEAALLNIKDVPAEVLDLTPEEFDKLVGEIRPALTRLPDDVATDVTNEVLTIIRSVVAISTILRSSKPQ
jgi:hypothetical protein